MSDTKLQGAIEQLYEAFAEYPMPDAMHASPLRDIFAIMDRLQSAPLRQLTPDAILPYAAAAMTTVGDPWHYGHFLPCIIELALDYPRHDGGAPWLIARKLNFADDLRCTNWKGWSDAQRSAVRAVFFEGWKHELEIDVDRQTGERWLNGLAQLGPLTDALQAWRLSPSPHAVGHLGSLVYDERDSLQAGKPIGRIFWSYVSLEIREQITSWLRKQSQLEWLESATPVFHSFEWMLIDGALRVLRLEP